MARPREFDEDGGAGGGAGACSAPRASTAPRSPSSSRRPASGGAASMARSATSARCSSRCSAATSRPRCASGWRGLRAPGAGRADDRRRVSRHRPRRATRDRERKGCMVTNCSIELADRDPDLACQAARGLDRFEHAFAARDPQAQARGEIARRARSRPPRPLPHRVHGGDAGPGPHPPRCGLARRCRGRRSRRRCAECAVCLV